MNKNTQEALLTLFNNEKASLESKGLTGNQVFGILLNKEYVSKSGDIFTLKSLGLVNSVFSDSPTQTNIDL